MKCLFILCREMWAKAVWLENDEEVEGTLPANWISEDDKTVRWPSEKKGRSKAYKNKEKPSSDWLQFELVKVKFKSEKVKECESYDLTTAESGVEEDSDEDKNEKRVPKKKMDRDFVTDFVSDDNEGVAQSDGSAKKSVASSGLQLPKPPSKVARKSDSPKKSVASSGLQLPKPPSKVSQDMTKSPMNVTVRTKSDSELEDGASQGSPERPGSSRQPVVRSSTRSPVKSTSMGQNQHDSESEDEVRGSPMQGTSSSRVVHKCSPKSRTSRKHSRTRSPVKSASVGPKRLRLLESEDEDRGSPVQATSSSRVVYEGSPKSRTPRKHSKTRSPVKSASVGPKRLRLLESDDEDRGSPVQATSSSRVLYEGSPKSRTSRKHSKTRSPVKSASVGPKRFRLLESDDEDRGSPVQATSSSRVLYEGSPKSRTSRKHSRTRSPVKSASVGPKRSRLLESEDEDRGSPVQATSSSRVVYEGSPKSRTPRKHSKTRSPVKSASVGPKRLRLLESDDEDRGSPVQATSSSRVVYEGSPKSRTPGKHGKTRHLVQSASPRSNRNTFKEKERAVATRGEDVFPLPPAKFQKRVINLLLDIKHEVKASRQMAEPGTIWSIEQMDDMRDFVRLEDSLTKENKRTAVVKSLSRLGGTNVRKNINEIMERLFTNRLLSEFNFAGKNRTGLYKKRSFESTRLYAAITDAVLIAHSGATQDDVKKAVQKNLQNAPFRMGGGGKKNV